MKKENEKSKSELEVEKLQLEVKDLKRHWLKKSNYLGILLPTLLAIFSLVWTLSSGTFDLKYQNLKLEKSNLEYDIKKFNSKKDSIQSVITKYRDSLLNIRSTLRLTEDKLFNSFRKQEKLLLENYKIGNDNKELIKYYQSMFDSLSNLRIKSNAIDKALISEDGEFIMTEDGKKIIIE